MNDDEWQRLPGLFYEHEIQPVLYEHHGDYRCEQIGANSIGIALFAVYHRLPRTAVKEHAQ